MPKPIPSEGPPSGMPAPVPTPGPVMPVAPFRAPIDGDGADAIIDDSCPRDGDSATGAATAGAPTLMEGASTGTNDAPPGSDSAADVSTGECGCDGDADVDGGRVCDVDDGSDTDADAGADVEVGPWPWPWPWPWPSPRPSPRPCPTLRGTVSIDDRDCTPDGGEAADDD
jgi:hypothetical protein